MEARDDQGRQGWGGAAGYVAEWVKKGEREDCVLICARWKRARILRLVDGGVQSRRMPGLNPRRRRSGAEEDERVATRESEDEEMPVGPVGLGRAFSRDDERNGRRIG